MDEVPEHTYKGRKIILTSWISVKEQLPEIDQDILVHIKGGGMAVVTFAMNLSTNEPAYLLISASTFLDARRVATLRNVTHWMPLPELPDE